MRFGGKTPGRAFRRRIGCCEHWLPSTAGEVGDGPDQGHSGGADSVPPAPESHKSLSASLEANSLPAALPDG